MSRKQYDTRDGATRAWLRHAKRAGRARILGGGWWAVEGWRRPVQGWAVLASQLERRQLIVRVPAADPEAASGVWAWELVPVAQPAPQAAPEAERPQLPAPRLTRRCPLCGRTRRTAARAWCKHGHAHAEMAPVARGRQ